MEDIEIDAVRCILCPKAFASEKALSNHVKLEHVEAYETGDCSMWILIDDDSNVKKEIDTVKCLLCSKGFASEAALKNHAKLEHSNAFQIGDPSIWKYEKASKHQSNTKKSRTSHNFIKQLPQKDTEELNKEDSCNQTNPTVLVDIKRETEGNEDSNNSMPVETIIEESRCNVNSVGAFVELTTDSESTAEEPNPLPTKSKNMTSRKKSNTNKMYIGVPVLTHVVIEKMPKEVLTIETEHIITDKMPTEKQFKCRVCPKKFNQQHNLDRHFRIHTNEKPYKCKTCQKCFTQLNNLERHNKIHTSEKQFQCAVCKKCFNQKNNLERHFRTHTSEKPFQCFLCEKSFSQKNNLDRHFRCHTGEEQFVCFICKMGFNQKSNLDRHMRVHDSKKQYHHQMIKKLV